MNPLNDNINQSQFQLSERCSRGIIFGQIHVCLYLTLSGNMQLYYNHNLSQYNQNMIAALFFCLYHLTLICCLFSRGQHDHRMFNKSMKQCLIKCVKGWDRKADGRTHGLCGAHAGGES